MTVTPLIRSKDVIVCTGHWQLARITTKQLVSIDIRPVLAPLVSHLSLRCCVCLACGFILIFALRRFVVVRRKSILSFDNFICQSRRASESNCRATCCRSPARSTNGNQLPGTNFKETSEALTCACSPRKSRTVFFLLSEAARVALLLTAPQPPVCRANNWTGLQLAGVSCV